MTPATPIRRILAPRRAVTGRYQFGVTHKRFTIALTDLLTTHVTTRRRAIATQAARHATAPVSASLPQDAFACSLPGPMCPVSNIRDSRRSKTIFDACPGAEAPGVSNHKWYLSAICRLVYVHRCCGARHAGSVRIRAESSLSQTPKARRKTWRLAINTSEVPVVTASLPTTVRSRSGPAS
jgi:hypothetical protein